MVKSGKINVVFFGTPAGVSAYIHQLYRDENLLAVVTQPPKVSGRGFKLVNPPVGEEARQLCIKHFYPERLDDKKFLDELGSLEIDLCVVAAFGRKIPRECLDIPKNGFINIHYSLLPKYRGPAPIQHALLNSEKTTGVTVFFLNEKIDEGPIIAQKELEITRDDDYISLENKLTSAGQVLLEETIGSIKKSAVKYKEQKGEASRAPLIKKEDGRIKWEMNAYRINAQVKAFIKWPKAFFKIPDGSFANVLKASVSPSASFAELTPGTVAGVEKNRGFVVKCGDLGLVIERLCPQGKKEMPAWAFWQGGKLKIGDMLV